MNISMFVSLCLILIMLIMCIHGRKYIHLKIKQIYSCAIQKFWPTEK